MSDTEELGQILGEAKVAARALFGDGPPSVRCARCRCELIAERDEVRSLTSDDVEEQVCVMCFHRAAADAGRATIPRRFADVTFASPHLRVAGEAALAKARKSLDVERAVFIGRAGSGKTSLAVAMLQAVLDRGSNPSASKSEILRAKGARFTSAYALSKARAQHPLGSGEAPNITEAIRAAVLVIDDLGSEKDGHHTAVNDVIYERHQELRTTWVTTGIAREDLAKRYGGGIARRLLEGATVIHTGDREANGQRTSSEQLQADSFQTVMRQSAAAHRLPPEDR